VTHRRIVLLLGVFCATTLNQQGLLAQNDGRIIFTDPKSPKEKVLSEEDLKPRRNAGGADILLGNDGFGLGLFYHHMLSESITSFATLVVSEVKDSRQREYFDIWTGEQPINKINRVFRLPLFAGVQYRLFKDDIVDNFRPYVQAAAGPVMLYIAPARDASGNDIEFFSSLGSGSPRYSFGGMIGAGALFGFDRTSVVGVNVRYLIIPVPSGVQSVEQGELENANGFFLGLTIGFAF
jgi:hypothetical protein